MALTLIWLCSAAVFAFCAASDETFPEKCSSQAEQIHELLTSPQAASELSSEQTASLLLSLKSLSDVLHKQQLKECFGSEPKFCPDADVPDHGGLACVTMNHTRYCQPLCDHGYDFAFLRRSRLYDECSEATGNTWSSQYGGNTLAVCNQASVQVSGMKEAYFPTSCVAAKASGRQRNDTIQRLVSALRNHGVQAEPGFACLVCGKP